MIRFRHRLSPIPNACMRCSFPPHTPLMHAGHLHPPSLLMHAGHLHPPPLMHAGHLHPPPPLMHAGHLTCTCLIVIIITVVRTPCHESPAHAPHLPSRFTVLNTCAPMCLRAQVGAGRAGSAAAACLEPTPSPSPCECLGGRVGGLDARLGGLGGWVGGGCSSST